MTIGEVDFTEPLVNAEVNPATTTPRLFAVAENLIAVTRPSREGHGNNLASHDLLGEKGTSRWVWAEVREQCWLAGPIMCMYMLQYIMSTSCTVFLGHLGAFYLAAVTLANSFCSMVGFTVLVGMSTAMETLCGQAYGARQHHLLGVFLQRAIFILLVTCAPIVALCLNMERILVASGQEPAIAHAAQIYAYWLFPALLLYAFLYPLIKFFQTQRAVFQLMSCVAVTVVFHVPLLWFVVDWLDVGYVGVAVAYDTSMVVNLVAFVSFIRLSPRFEKTFPSFTWDAFQDLGDFFRLAIPSAIMLCLEHWAYEGLMLLAGLLPNPKLNLSSVAICMGLLALSNTNALALAVATSVRVANEMGAGKAHAARSVVAVSLFIGTVYGMAMASLIYSLRHIWGWAFSNDLEVVQHVANTAPYLAVIASLYALGAVLTGVVRGIGWQRVGAIANLGAYYAVGLPVAFVSSFVFHLDAKGLWLGMGCGLVTQIIALISIILCANWDQLAQEALLRSYSFSAKLSTPSLPLTKPLLVEDGSSFEEQ